MGKPVKVIKRPRSRNANQCALSQSEVTKAIVYASQKQKELEKTLKKQQMKEFKCSLGITENNNRSTWIGIGKLLLNPKKYKAGSIGIGSSVLLTSFIKSILILVQLFLFSAALYLPYILISSHYTSFLSGVAGDIFKTIGSLITFCVSVYFALLFGLLRLELEEMDEKSKLLALFSAIVSVATFVQPIIPHIKKSSP